ncbi:MAG TPA: SCO family protein [Tepidisphaeraceae bacterium]|jgi:protein SCO1/2
MSKRKKILATSLWVIAVLAMAALVACLSEIRAHEARAAQVQPTVGEPAFPEFNVADFSVTDQLNRPVSNQSLKGHVWVAAFIFTRCTQLCPMMSTELAVLQHKITNPSVKIVSFTVDPQYDTPAILKTYGQRYNADSDRWFLVTGNQKTIGDVATSLKLGVALGPNPNVLTHSDKLVLIGPDGVSRGVYSGIDENDIKKLAADADKLAAQSHS